MKKKYSLSICLCLFLGLAQAQYSTRSFSYDGLTRNYILYIPVAYDSTHAHPLVLALHGLGDNMANFRTGINLKPIADSAKFIFVVPQAIVETLFTNASAWNSGAGLNPGFTLNPNVDDVGFLNALMDTVAANYNIDQTRIYATGFSMGGYMSNRLACELNNRVAAIASVSGTIGKGLICQPTRAIPVAHFHGTADSAVLYHGNLYGNDPEVLVKYWIDNNGCDTTAIIDSLPDTKSDGKSVIRYKYLNGDFNTEVEFYKVIGGEHEWLTSANDITYSVEIWRFFSRFQWTDQIATGIRQNEMAATISVYPNPAQNEISIRTKGAHIQQIILTDISGKNILQQSAPENAFAYTLNTSSLANGIYFAAINCGEYSVTKKIVISK